MVRQGRTVYARLHGRFFKLRLADRFYRRLDNGRMVSIGLTDEDGISLQRLRRWEARGVACEVEFDEWTHSSCQSSCTRRGDPACLW